MKIFVLKFVFNSNKIFNIIVQKIDIDICVFFVNCLLYDIFYSIREEFFNEIELCFFGCEVFFRIK